MRDKGFEAMLDAPGIAVIDETGRETPGDVEQAVGLAQQQDAIVGGHPADVKKGRRHGVVQGGLRQAGTSHATTPRFTARVTNTYRRPLAGFPPEMGRDQRAQPVEAAAHVRRFRRQPDAARQPATEHQDRRRRSTTPSPSECSTSQPGPDAAAILTKTPGLPAAAPAVRSFLRRQL